MDGKLHIAVLGELAVSEGGALLPLPPSRKTRALLAYLALNPRPHRRDRLSGLFWDVADDTRGALRWSLSKLRRVLDVGGVSRLVATRHEVELRKDTVTVDWLRVRARATRALDQLDTDTLLDLSGAFRGELLEGLFLPDFDEFEAWLEAERAEARAIRVRLLRTLVQRLSSDPARALPIARTWLQATGGANPDAMAAVQALSSQLGATIDERPAARSAPRVAPPSRRADGPPFTARERELSRLLALVEAARSGSGPKVVLVRGAPGLGKTRLLNELSARAQEAGACILMGSCYEAERGRSFGPFVDALRRLEDDDLAGPEFEPLRELRAASGSGLTDREALFNAFSRFLRLSAQAHGLCLLLLDDAHSSDESSTELLHYAVRTAGREPLLVILGCRAPDLSENAALQRCLQGFTRRGELEELPLEPLPDASMRQLVVTWAPSCEVESVVERSGGNPFFALELARAGSADVPPTLAGAIQARLQTLSPQAQALCRWAAVMDRGYVEHLEAIAAAEVTDFVPSLEEAEQYGFVRIEAERGGLRFAMTHALSRQVIEENLSTVRRAAMHRAVATHLSKAKDRPDLAPVIAHHAVLADSPGTAVRACLEAAVYCAAWKGSREAEELVALGLAHAARLPKPERTDREIELLEVLSRVKRPGDVQAVVERLIELGDEALAANRPGHAQRAFHLVGNLRWEHDEPEQAQKDMLRALRASRSADPADQAMGLATSAMCLALLERNLSEADARLLEAEAQVRLAAHRIPQISMVRGVLHAHRGDHARAREAFRDALSLARAQGVRPVEASLLEHYMRLELAAGQLDEASALAVALRELSTRIREGGEGPLAAAVLALIEGSPEALDGALSELLRLDDKRRSAFVLNQIAERALSRGALDEAREAAERAFDLASRVSAGSEAAIALSTLLACAARTGDDALYARSEERLAAVEGAHVLSAEAVARVRRATRFEPSSEGDTAWNS